MTHTRRALLGFFAGLPLALKALSVLPETVLRMRAVQVPCVSFDGWRWAYYEVDTFCGEGPMGVAQAQ